MFIGVLRAISAAISAVAAATEIEKVIVAIAIVDAAGPMVVGVNMGADTGTLVLAEQVARMALVTGVDTPELRRRLKDGEVVAGYDPKNDPVYGTALLAYSQGGRNVGAVGVAGCGRNLGAARGIAHATICAAGFSEECPVSGG